MHSSWVHRPSPLARELQAALAADRPLLIPAARAGHGHCAH